MQKKSWCFYYEHATDTFTKQCLAKNGKCCSSSSL